MPVRPLNINSIPHYLVPFTQLRRNPNYVVKKAQEVGGVVVTKSGRPLVGIVPVIRPATSEEIQKRVAKIRSLSGKLNLGADFTAEEMNRLLDGRYEEMLSR